MTSVACEAFQVLALSMTTDVVGCVFLCVGNTNKLAWQYIFSLGVFPSHLHPLSAFCFPYSYLQLQLNALQASLLTRELGLWASWYLEQREGGKTRGTKQRNQTAQMNLAPKAKIS